MPTSKENQPYNPDVTKLKSILLSILQEPRNETDETNLASLIYGALLHKFRFNLAYKNLSFLADKIEENLQGISTYRPETASKRISDGGIGIASQFGIKKLFTGQGIVFPFDLEATKNLAKILFKHDEPEIIIDYLCNINPKPTRQSAHFLLSALPEERLNYYTELSISLAIEAFEKNTQGITVNSFSPEATLGLTCMVITDAGRFKQDLGTIAAHAIEASLGQKLMKSSVNPQHPNISNLKFDNGLNLNLARLFTKLH